MSEALKGKTEKELFRKHVRFLVDVKNLKARAIAKELGVDEHKIYNAYSKGNRSFKFEEWMLERLHKEFPQAKGGLPSIDELEDLTPEERKEILKKFPKEDIEAMLDEMDREDFLALNAIKEYEQRIKGLEGDKQKLQEEKDRLLRTLENISTNFKK